MRFLVLVFFFGLGGVLGDVASPDKLMALNESPEMSNLTDYYMENIAPADHRNDQQNPEQGLHAR